MKILLVEDDPIASELLATTLTNHHYAIDTATNGQDALDLTNLWDYDLIILDIEISGLDGISVCRQLRSQGYTIPILMLTAQNSSEDIIRGLDAGADDYVTKPWDFAQLLARIRALFRRQGDRVPTHLLSWGSLCLNPNSAHVTYQQQAVALRPKEYRLLEMFLRYPQRIFSRNAILDHLWTLDDCPTEHAVTNLIKDLRRSLKSSGMTEELIETVYGLGYRLNNPPCPTAEIQKTEAPKTSSLQQNTTKQDDRSPKGLAAIDRIAERFQASLDGRLQQLEEVSQALQVGHLRAAQREAAREEAHRLAGSLGTFGYIRGSELARAIERLLTQDGLEAKQISHFSQLLVDLQQEITRSPILPSVADSSLKEIPVVLLVSNQMIGNQMISNQMELIEAIDQQAPDWNLQLKVILDSEIPQRLETPPTAILFMLGSANDQEFARLQDLKAQFLDVPVLVLAAQDSLNNRVRLARMGIERYVSQPATPAEILEVLSQLLSQSQSTHARVMIMDDDPIMLSALAHLLKPWGLQVICLNQPDQFWQVLTSTQPNLLLLDIEMPTFNGIELCRVVRQDPKYGNLPILIITSHTDPALMQQVFAAGADDLIIKPVIGPELITRVISRVERSCLRQQLDQLRQHQTQLLQRQVRTDPLTQIDNRRAFDEDLQQEWQRLMHESASLSLILCDVDCFKSYNDRYGHLAGDECLKQIANTLQRCLKLESDRVARYGGEEFGIILPNTNLNGALWIVDRIQQAIAQLQIPHENSPVSSHATLSMGITGTIPTAEKSVADLISTADRALYAAKAKGRNTYCLYPL